MHFTTSKLSCVMSCIFKTVLRLQLTEKTTRYQTTYQAHTKQHTRSIPSNIPNSVLNSTSTYRPGSYILISFFNPCAYQSIDRKLKSVTCVTENVILKLHSFVIHINFRQILYSHDFVFYSTVFPFFMF